MIVKICDINVKRSVSWFSNPIEFSFLEFGSIFNKEPRIEIILVDSEDRSSISSYPLKDLSYFEVYDGGALIDKWVNSEYKEGEDYEKK